ncbi:Flagellar motor switch protein FliN [Botrimarina colliarenosi]|uniref:Flagellar motor switch protein FliN n=1 Tax=Botrimarina colliarenosi TaxID=2528001 RepID=A0A5C6AKZ4_9BACT|nr:flagellar motor switch protein FliN [Botrimarina colliarenosi]TWU00320.1 Flagellar motor switch protein FliN [Botrimarina colliarenosi]
MSDDAQLNQDDIEALLSSAGSSSKPAPPPASEPASDTFALGQDEIEALISGGATPSATPAAASAVASGPSTAASLGAGTGPSSDVELLLDKAQAAIASIDQLDAESLPDGVQPFRLESFGGSPANTEAATLELVRDVQLDLKIELGRTRMPIEDVLRLRRDAVVTLDKLAGDPVDVYVNGRLIARGEVLVLNDNFCVRVTELIVGDSAVA